MKEKEVVNARRINKMRFIVGIVICSLVIAITFTGVALNLVDYFNYGTPESGIHNLRMFTTISNIIAAIAAFLCLPFQIDGLRRDRYNLPSWIAILMYVGAAGAFLTFICALTLISAVNGFVQTMFMNSNIFFHTLNPLLITVAFTLIISDTHIKFSRSFIPLVPIVIYMFIYFLMVFVFKQWRDHYQTDKFIPWPVSLILILGVSFGICQLLRFLHNLSNKYINQKIVDYYMKSSDFDFPKVSNAISHLASLESKFFHEGDDIYIPTDIIKILSDRFGADIVPLDILYDIYLEQYLISIGKKAA